jgi:hypothetical protein
VQTPKRSGPQKDRNFLSETFLFPKMEIQLKIKKIKRLEDIAKIQNQTRQCRTASRNGTSRDASSSVRGTG